MIHCEYIDAAYIKLLKIVISAGLPDSEDGINHAICTLVLTQHWRVTDRQTDRLAVAKTALSVAGR